MNMHKIVQPVSFGKIITPTDMFSKLWHHIFRELTDKVKMYCYFTQDNATADTATLSMTALKGAFKIWLITKRLWPT